MSAAPNNRARLRRYNVGSQSRQHESVVGARSRGRFSMAEETSMAQVLLLMQQQMAAQQRMLEQMAAAPPLAQQAATAAAAAPPETRPSTMRIDFEKFSGEPEDWNAWPKVYMAQISALGCEDVLTTPAVQDVKVGADNFDGRQVNPETLRKAKQVWVSLITNCKGVAFEIVQGADSPSQA